MSLLVSIFVILFGLALGSFLNVCISRLPHHASIVKPPSHCPYCKRSIRPAENIPLLSWLLLRGRCRGCRQPISGRYPLIELTTAFLFLLSYLIFGLNVTGIAIMVLCFLLLGLAAMDAETMTLPDTFTLPGIALGVLYCAVTPDTSLRGRLIHIISALLWGTAAALLLLLIRWIYYRVRRQEGLGLGDVKLLAMIAVWTGPRLTAEVLFLGVVSAAVYGLLRIALHPKQGTANLQLPLGSFLSGAALFAIFEGEALFKWYLQFFR